MTYPTWDVLTAHHLASFAHTGQTDKAGERYILHPVRVVGYLTEDPAFKALNADEQSIATMVAWLHDVLEDTAVTTSMLSDLGCPEEVNFLIRLLTRPRVVTESITARYYRNIAEDPIALMVKAADIADNADPKRLALLSPDTQRGLIRTYTKARKALGLEGA